MSTTRPVACPEMRAHSVGLVVSGRFSLSLISAVMASMTSAVLSPPSVAASLVLAVCDRARLIAKVFARSTILASIAPETKSAQYRSLVCPSARWRVT